MSGLLSKQNVQDLYGLSPLQKGMLFHHLHDQEQSAYFEQTTFEIAGKVDAHCLEASFQHLIERYDIFRTVFVYEKVNQPMQVVLKKRPAQMTFIDLSNQEAAVQMQELDRYTQEDRQKKFDLSKDMLIRLALIQTSANDYKLIFSFHHILMDGWCLGIVLKDLLAIYASKRNGTLLQLKPAPKYREYIRWLKQQDESAAQKFWGEYLQNYEDITGFSFSEPNKNAGYELDECCISMEREQTQRLEQVAQTYQVTLNTLVQAVWGILLQKYNRCQDAVFGAVVSGRPTEIDSVEEIVGLFINTIPVRIRCQDTKQTFATLLTQTQQAALRQDQYQFVSLAEMPTETGNASQLVNHILAFENYPFDERLIPTDIGFQLTDITGMEQTNYDLNVLITAQQQLGIKFNFNKQVYDPAYIQQLAKHFQHLLVQVSANPEIAISALQLVTPAERNRLLYEFNPVPTELPTGQTILSLFAKQVAQHPNKLAVVCGETQLTYAQLDAQSNQLARRLNRYGITAEQLVGLLVHNSAELVIGMLGTLKAGGAFLPIDPTHPAERITQLLTDSQTKILLTQPDLTGSVDFAGERIILTSTSWEHESSSPLSVNPHSQQLAYVIYTSGSTGKPKGVMVTHRSLVNLATWHNDTYEVTALDRATKFASVGFDASIWEVFPYLIAGATLYVIPEAVRYQIADLHDFYEQQRITISFLPTQWAEQFIAFGDHVTLRRLLVGGDQLHQVNQTNYRIYNNYGPTENTVVTTSTQIHPGQSVIPIGRPIANNQVYVLNEASQLQPIGVPGELCISGASLARGYLYQHALTASKFVPNPFIPGEKMYRTGDLVSWLPDGQLAFLGRIDQQVKIRGYRIELGEIEATLLSHPAVSQAVVITKRDESQQLLICAYVVMDDTEDFSSFRAHLAKTLPAYMIPSHFVKLDAMPLTPNGKVDARALPEPEISATSKYEAPVNQTEATLVEIFKQTLHVAQVSTTDHFFECGGHSLKAIQLMAKIQKNFGVNVPLRAIFANPTVRKLAAYVRTAATSEYQAIEPVEAQDFYPVSSAQKRMYVLQGFENIGAGYNLPIVLEMEGTLEVERLQAVLQQLVDRHEILRTSYHVVEGQVMQKLHQQVVLPLIELQTTVQEVKQQVAELIQPFDLAQAPLLRAYLLHVTNTRTVLLLDLHHIATDGVSMQVLIQELMDCYQGKSLPSLQIQYKDYAAWQQARLTSESMHKQATYWQQQFTDEVPVLELPTDFPRPLVQQFRGGLHSFSLSEELTQQLKEVAMQGEATLYMVMLACYKLFLMKLTGQSDLVVGTPVAGRPHADLEQTVGMFVNTLAIRTKPQREQRFAEFLQQVKEQVLAGQEHSEYPLEELIDALGIRRDLSRNPLFDTLFVFQNMNLTQFALPGLTLREFELDWQAAKFDLAWNLVEQDGLQISIEYNTDLFTPATLSKFAAQFQFVVEQLVANPRTPLQAITLVTPNVRKELLATFNDTAANVLADQTVVSRFTKCAQQHPEQIAVVCGDTQLAYRQLDQQANRLAHTLLACGVSRGDLVGLLVDRSLEMVVGILGILKAGAAYVPIEPSYPAERIDYLLADSGAQVLLTQQHQTVPAHFTGEVICLDQPDAYAVNTTAPAVSVQPDDLIYAIYTSGSTGKPKGVLVEHRNVVRLWFNDRDMFRFDTSEVWAMFHSYCFDVSVWELFGALLHGGKLVLIPESVAKEPAQLLHLLRSEKVTTLCQTPSAFAPLSAEEMQAEETAQALNLRRIIFAGEALAPSQLKDWQQKHPQTQLINMYGPTEITVYATYKEITPVDITQDISNIGKPMPTLRAYVLDADQQLVPVGVKGELYIAGAGVTRGYLNRAELNQERFLADPFVSGQRMYRTGDFVRWLPNGELEYLGRMDDQVKIRGYRIELGEIETVLRRHPEVQEAVVIARQEQEATALCAYIVGDADKLVVNELRDHIGQSLPSYMIPSYFVQLESLPLTVNGKLDKRALPAPTDQLSLTNTYVAPRNEMEAQLASLWQAVLQVEQIGVTDDFFELGGHSLKAVSLVSRIQQALEVELPLKALFAHPTIAELAEHLGEATHQAHLQITPAPVQAHYPVTSMQKRLYVLQEMENVGTTYHLPTVFEIKGNLSIERIRFALNQLISRHEALRTSFYVIEDEIRQRIHQTAQLVVQQISVDPAHVQAEITRWMQPFDLGQAPLLRACVMQLTEERQLLVIDMHHIISDGISLQLLVQEFMSLYQGTLLTDPKLHYKDYAVWQQQAIVREYMDKQADYWLDQLSGELPVLELPTDFPRPLVQQFAGARVELALPKSLTTQLQQLAQMHGVTLYMVLLAAYYTLLMKSTGQEDFVVGTPVAGRPHADLEQMVGMFVNTLAIRTKPQRGQSFATFLQHVKEQVLSAQEHSEYPLEELIEQLGVQRDLSRNPLFDTMFVLQNMEQTAVDVPGLSIAPYELASQTAKFDLTWTAVEQETLHLSVEYSTALFSEQTVVRMVSQFQSVLEQLVANSRTPLQAVTLVTPDVSEQLLTTFNDTDTHVPADQTVVSLFAQCAQQHPEQPAVVCGDAKLTYRQLDQQANQLAHTLLASGVSRGDLVGLLVNRSLEMVVGILGILKAGAAYVPIEPSYPAERIDYLLADSGAQVLLTQQHQTVPTHFTGEVICLDQPAAYSTNTTAPVVAVQPDDLIYAIYTSGSTGKPKGVLVEHRNVVRLWFNDRDIFHFDTSEVWAMFHSYCFDVSVWELFGALLHGGKLVLIPEATAKEPAQLLRLLRSEQVTTLCQTPSAFAPLSVAEMQAEETAQALNLQRIIFAGEALVPSQLEDWQQKHPQTQLINMYGPTEITVYATYKEITPADIAQNISNIGKPLPTLRAYVLDADQQLVPVGVKGELYIAGAGVTRGYLNRDELNQERFLTDPFVSGQRMYRTGDFVRWLPNGELEYLGRMDDQVKIRGYRIELGEIETVLRRHPGVQAAVVIAHQEQEATALCAYIVGNTATDITVSELRDHIGQSLPSYMIPSYFVQLESLPLTVNGKLDKRALPTPTDQLSLTNTYVAPRNEMEMQLTSLWQAVLQVEQIGVTDDFFELGGHSLKAVSLVSRIQHALEVELPLKALFAHPTIAELAKYLGEAAHQAHLQITPAPVQANYPVTSMQKRLYVLQEMENIGAGYHMPVALELIGDLDLDRLQESLDQLVARHEALRTAFALVDGELVQTIVPAIELPIQQVRLSSEQSNDSTSMQAAISQAVAMPFDLSQAPLIRVSLFTQQADRHILLLNLHHIIADGLSVQQLLQEFIAFYQGKTLPELRIQYKDYAVWQQQSHVSEQIAEQATYWQEQMAGELPVLALPTDFARPVVQQFAGNQVVFTLPAEMAEKLQQLANNQGSTLYMTLFAVYKLLLTKYTDQQDLIVGMPVAGRPHVDLESVMGMFVNTLAIRTKPVQTQSFIQLLSQVQAQVLSAQANSLYPLEELIEQLNLKRDLSRNPLFDTVFTLQNLDSPDLQLGELTIAPYALPTNTAKFDLTWTVVAAEGLTIAIEYSTALFTQATIERMGQHFRQLLQQVIAQPTQKLAEIELVTPVEKAVLLEEFGSGRHSRADIDTEKHSAAMHDKQIATTQQHSKRQVMPIHEQFLLQAAATPKQYAVVSQHGRMTYQEIRLQANQLARYLRSRGVGREDIVGILSDNRPEMLVGILGVLLAGAAYLPIDPTYPSDRISYMLDDSGARCLLRTAGMDIPTQFAHQVIELRQDVYAHQLDTDLRSINTATDLAYVIYTSGSTGKPKGVMVQHQALDNLARWHNRYYDVTSDDRATKFASFGFDASVWEIFPYLLAGATLYMIPEQIRHDLVALGDYYQEHQITISFLPTQLAEQFMLQPHPSLRALLVGGDQLRQVPETKYRVYNNYGPTENAVVTTSTHITAGQDVLPIGRPIDHNFVYVLNQHQQLQPIGVPGELCISGASLAKGYLHRPDLTAAAFVPNPYRPGEVMYRTGDLVCWQADGQLAYLGRIDQQVKVRGYRIELGEIEYQLLQQVEVTETVVVARNEYDGQTTLCAYLVGAEQPAAHWRQLLGQTLPTYMIPAHFIHLDALPMTPNGKVDMKALPAPQMATAASEYVAPNTATEQLLADIWSQVLKQKQVSITANFFELGGDSIKAMQIIAQLSQADYQLKMKQLFQHPTIQELAPLLTKIDTKQAQQQEIVEGEVHLTPIQRWAFEQTPNIHHWNMGHMLYRREGYDPERLRRAFAQIVEHHDALRMTYSFQQNDQIVQFNRGLADPPYFTLDVFDLTGESDLAGKILVEADRLQQSIRLDQGPLVRLGLFQTTAGDHLLLIVHHLVVDAISLRILVEDLDSTYQQAIDPAKPIRLPAKTDSFQTWSRQLTQYANGEAIQQEVSYWEQFNQTVLPSLPTDRPGDTTYDIGNGKMVHMTLTEAETKVLMTDVHQAYQTEINDLLLAALAQAIRQWSGVEQIGVMMESHGRQEIHEAIDITRTVGWFTAMYPVIFQLAGVAPNAVIKTVKETLRQVPQKGIGYSVLKYLTEPSALANTTDPEVIFNYLGEIDSYSIEAMPVGHAISPQTKMHAKLDVNSAVSMEGVFILSIRYNPKLYDEQTMESLLLHVRQQLQAMIRQCEQQVEIGVSGVMSE